MIKAKVIVRYKDIKLDKLLEAGELIEISEERLEEINSKGFGILVEKVEEDGKEEKTEIEEVTENEEEIKDVEVEEKPKKKTTNKK